MINKVVKYVGKTEAGLIRGKTYNVELIDYSTKCYKLKDISGKFSIDLFKEITEEDIAGKPVYISFSKNTPEIGKVFFLIRIDKGNIEPVKISDIIDIEYLEGDICRIETVNSVYLTEIIC